MTVYSCILSVVVVGVMLFVVCINSCFSVLYSIFDSSNESFFIYIDWAGRYKRSGVGAKDNFRLRY